MNGDYPATVANAWGYITAAYSVGGLLIFGYGAWLIWDGLRLKRLRELVKGADK